VSFALDIADGHVGTLTMTAISWDEFDAGVDSLLAQMRAAHFMPMLIYAIPRGGVVLGAALSHAFNVPLRVGTPIAQALQPTTLVVDDNTVTGWSLKSYIELGIPTAVLMQHPDATSPRFVAWRSTEFPRFPWEIVR
jgi:hypothetical protein